VKVPKRACFAFLGVLLITVEPVDAQEDERRGFIGLGIGPSLPLGSFGDQSLSNPQGGRAMTGYTDTLLNLGYRFGQSLGLAAAFSYSEYPTRGLGDDDWWQVAGITVGPMYSISLNARSALDLKMMFGGIVVTPVEDGYTTNDGVGTGVAVDIRAALRYDLFRRWALFAESGFQSSGVSFDSGAQKSYRALISGLGVAFRPTW
jgi:hypothetical protein